MSLLRQPLNLRPQPPPSQDPVYGAAWQPHDADTRRAPFRMQQQEVRSGHILRAPGDDPSLWASHL